MWEDGLGAQPPRASTEHGLRLTPARPQGHGKPRPPTAGGSFRGVTARGTRGAVSAPGTGMEGKLSTGRPRVLAARSLLRDREELRSAGQVSPRSRSCCLPGHLGTATWSPRDAGPLVVKSTCAGCVGFVSPEMPEGLHHDPEGNEEPRGPFRHPECLAVSCRLETRAGSMKETSRPGGPSKAFGAP